MKITSLALMGALALTNGSLWAASSHEDSRSRGAFAGITLDGAVVEQDNDSTRAIYGRDQSFQTILSGKVPAPKSTLTFMKAIAQTGRSGTVAELKRDKQ